MPTIGSGKRQAFTVMSVNYCVRLRCFLSPSSSLTEFVCISALCEETLWDTMVSLAENMTLECVYPFMDNLTQAEWIKIVGKQEQSMAVFHPTLGVVIQKPYENKVHFLNSAMALHDMTLSFNNASEADVGTYYCLFLTFPQGSWQKTIQVVQSGKESCFLFITYNI